jgi:hypothetical protein
MQNFFINQNSTLPVIQMKLVKDGRSDSIAHESFFQALQNASIYFTMIDVETGIHKVAHQKCFLIEEPGCAGEFNIAYQWKTRDTMRPGKYRGQFEIVFANDNVSEFVGQQLIVPITDELIINVTEGVIKK